MQTKIRFVALVAFFFSGVPIAKCADTPAIHITSPVPYQVAQREGFIPARAGSHEPGGPVMGSAKVRVTLVGTPADVALEYRIVLLENAFGKAVDWTALDGKLDDKKVWQGAATIPAGGWYKLEIRTVAAAGKPAGAAVAVEPVGVGEVFLVAGQSYAAGANDELVKVQDPQKRVVAFDPVAGTWRIANDPQPLVGDGGTIWPHLGDDLLPIAQVPIAFANVAQSATSSRQWLPGTPLYERMLKAGLAVGRFRAILWQQGESDVLEHVATEKYIENLNVIRASLVKEWKFAPPWLAAKSTIHPRVYNDPPGEAKIRAAIDQLWHTPGFARGPDTDTLDGENRGPTNSRQHFSAIGQRNAAMLWFTAVWEQVLNEPGGK